MHHWSDDDNLVAYCLFRFGNDAFSRDRHELGTALGMGFNSLSLKVANFKAISGAGGLEQYSEQALRIFTKYSSLPDDEVRNAGNLALQRACSVTTRNPVVTVSTASPEVLEAKLARAKLQLERVQAQLDEMRRRSGRE